MSDPLVFNVSWLAVALGAVALFVLGGIWYTVLFGKAYRTELGVPEDGPGPGDSLLKPLIGQLITSVVMALLLAWFIGAASIGTGALAGLGAGLLVGAAVTQLYQFEGRSIRHLLINVGYFLVGFTGVGALIGYLQTPL